MLRKAVSGVGRTLVTSGVILLLFVGYQLWGTGINTARAQSSLTKELGSGGFSDVPQDLLNGTPVVSAAPVDSSAPTTVAAPTTAAVTPVVTPATTISQAPTSLAFPSTLSVPSTIAVPSTLAGPATTVFGRELVTRKTSRQVSLRSGEAVGQLVIPRISVDKAIVQGTSVEALKKGPGHYKTTPFPGEEGNAAIACHRTTYGGPCFRLDELKPGDPIFVARKDAKGNAQWFRYNVYERKIVKPSSNEVLLPQEGRNTLTLTTCHPQYSAKQRLVIHAELVGAAVESELIDAANDPLSDEYKRQLDAKTQPAPTPTTASAPDPTSTVTEPVTETTFEDPVVGETVPPGPSSVVAPTTSPTTSPTPLPELQSPETPAAEAPSFDGERSTGTLYRFVFFTGTAAAWLNTLAWALVCGAIWLFVWLLARRRRNIVLRWGLYGVGFVLLFAPALYFCFENVSRLLPEAV